MSRPRYEQQLEQIRSSVMDLGDRVEAALGQALRALTNANPVLASHVIAGDAAIDMAQRDLEATVLAVLATQQPVARDLCYLVATTAIAAELERMGDYARRIAKKARAHCATNDELTIPPAIMLMSEEAQAMLRTAIGAFATLDCNLARTLAAADMQVDELRRAAASDVLAQARLRPDAMESAWRLLSVAQLLERFADRSTNIGERVIFVATREIEQLNTGSRQLAVAG